jgi:signal transduction histidine kinase
LGLTVIGFLAVGFYFLNQTIIDQKEFDAPLINVAGRQRMFSQKISKNILLLINIAEKSEKMNLLEEIKADFKEWKNVHSRIRNENNLYSVQTKIIRAHFREIHPYFENMKQNIELILEKPLPQTASLSFNSPQIRSFLRNSNLYLKWMNRIVSEYEKQAVEKQSELENYQVIIVSGILLSLLLAGMFIFYPMEKKIVTGYRELERSNRELEHFASVVSHDLKTPLTAIHSTAQILLMESSKKLNFEEKQYLVNLKNNTEKMAELIDGILHYSQIQSKPNIYEKTDLNSIMNEIIPTVHSLNPDMKVQIPAQLPKIPANPIEMKQLFQNLMANSAIYADKTNPWIKITCDDAGKFWRFHVRDNGAGIPPEEQESIFELFKTLNPEGIGIGLATVKKIVEKYGGVIRVESAPGECTTFTFTLPKGE